MIIIVTQEFIICKKSSHSSHKSIKHDLLTLLRFLLVSSH